MSDVKITNQAHKSVSILDIYNTNPYYSPTRNTISLLSTENGNVIASKLNKVLLNPVIFEKGLSSYYCPEDSENQYFNKYKTRN